MEMISRDIVSFQTNLDRDNMYDHMHKISNFLSGIGIEIIGTDTTYIPEPNNNTSTRKGDIITILTYTKKMMSL